MVLVADFLATMIAAVVFFVSTLMLVAILLALRTGQSCRTVLDRRLRGTAGNSLALAPLAG